jgi:hypothetical protein
MSPALFKNSPRCIPALEPGLGRVRMAASQCSKICSRGAEPLAQLQDLVTVLMHKTRDNLEDLRF